MSLFDSIENVGKRGGIQFSNGGSVGCQRDLGIGNESNGKWATETDLSSAK